jgi:hypothetical protein
MKKLISLLSASIAVLLTSACAGLPPLHDVGTNRKDANENTPPIGAIIHHVECEIANAMSDSSDPDIKAFLDYDYVVYVSLTLDETFNEGLTPSLAYIHPFATAGTNFTLSASGALSGQQHRNFVQSFTIDLDRKALTQTAQMDCSPLSEKSSGIRGQLGLRQVIVEGGRHRDQSAYLFPVLGDESNLDQQQKDAVSSISGQLLPTFASTVDFTLTYGLTGGGPMWTVTHFTGPGGTSGLVNYTRTNKNTVLLSFASAQKHVELKGLTPQQGADLQLTKARAAQSAQTAATRILLQQLRLLP